MRSFIASLKMLGFVIACLIAVPPQIIIMLFTKGPAAQILPQLWMKLLCAVFGIRITVEGKPYRDGQLITMSNHLSYLDIIVIGSIIPDSFVSKADVAKWPVFGFLAGLRRTAYVIRGSSDPKIASEGVENRLREGDSLVIFPEGTSTDGREVIDFKTGVFARALDAEVEDLIIQPLTLHVTSSDKRPIQTQDDRDLYAWHRDMDDDFELQHHLWRFAKTRGADIKLIFHEPIRAHDYEDRKTLAKATHKPVSSGLQNSIETLQ